MNSILCRQVGDTLVKADTGEVLSCNPSSLKAPYGPYRIGFRPPGTDQEYEKVAISGNIATYNPVGEAVAYLFMPSVPNTPAGTCAIAMEPLA